MAVACENPCESTLMDSLNPEHPTLIVKARREPRIWGFWGTALWGFAIFIAMFAGQALVMGYFLLRLGAELDRAAFIHVVGGGLATALSVTMGLPAVLAVTWLATRLAGISFSDYLALRLPSWRRLFAGILALFVLVMGWDAVSRATGHEVTAGFMGEVLQSGQADGVLWLMVLAFAVAAPISEEIFARGFLYRGWSESFVGPAGAILLSAAIWTALHLQYDWFFLGEVFSIGLLFGYLRYRSQSLWLTIILHGLNNLAAVIQTLLLTGSS